MTTQPPPPAKPQDWGFTFWGNCTAFLCRVIFQLDQFPTQLQAQLRRHKESNPQTRGCHQGHAQATKALGTSKTIQQLGIAALSKERGGRIRLELRKFYWGNEIVFTGRSQRCHSRKSQSQMLISHDQYKESWAEKPLWTCRQSWNQLICNLGAKCLNSRQCLTGFKTCKKADPLGRNFS